VTTHQREAISAQTAQRLYDRLGPHYDWARLAESKAGARAIELLDLQPGQSLLNLALGTGREQIALERKLAPGGLLLGLDLSYVMARLTRRRTQTGSFSGRTPSAPGVPCL
jgi:ubiquinone/menaquinone biosynthesis C-methylase UbiE